jgi:hypothetical protein
MIGRNFMFSPVGDDRRRGLGGNTFNSPVPAMRVGTVLSERATNTNLHSTRFRHFLDMPVRSGETIG